MGEPVFRVELEEDLVQRVGTRLVISHSSKSSFIFAKKQPILFLALHTLHLRLILTAEVEAGQAEKVGVLPHQPLTPQSFQIFYLFLILLVALCYELPQSLSHPSP